MKIQRQGGSLRRVALFTDSYHEANGVGTLCREYAAYARKRELPFLCAYGGRQTSCRREGSVEKLELRRSCLSFEVDAQVDCDPLLLRHLGLVLKRLREFGPDLLHITGPGDVSIVGLLAANILGIPVIASWHTNLHEYAQRRMEAILRWMPCRGREMAGRAAYRGSLWATTTYYQIVQFVAAPNVEMAELLHRKTTRPSFVMAHGVNTELFRPERRKRQDGLFSIGYVGRLTPEKNVRALVELERNLLESGERDFRVVVVGEGSERGWLRANLRQAEFAGVLRGEALAAAFAGMDAFVFPSLTDTFGLVMLEAMACGVPVVATPAAGRRVGVVDGRDGLLSDDFAGAMRRLMGCSETRGRMSAACRELAAANCWVSVFDDLHRIYDEGLRSAEVVRRMPTARFRGRVGTGGAQEHFVNNG